MRLSPVNVQNSFAALLHWTNAAECPKLHRGLRGTRGYGDEYTHQRNIRARPVQRRWPRVFGRPRRPSESLRPHSAKYFEAQPQFCAGSARSAFSPRVLPVTPFLFLYDVRFRDQALPLVARASSRGADALPLRLPSSFRSDM